MSTRNKRTGAPPPPASPPAPRPLVPDFALRFPRFVLIKASAGSGKTHALSLWTIQLLLSEAVREKTPNDLRNILAITFTRNATREMKVKILEGLKALCFGDEKKTREILELVSLDPAVLPREADRALEHLLGRYTDFQVETIDGFMAAVFKSSALDLGVPPHFDIQLDNSALMEYAFSRFLRTVTPDSETGRTFWEITRLISSAQKAGESFLWDPTPRILDKMAALHGRLSSQTGRPDLEDLEPARRAVLEKVTRRVGRLRSLIDASGLRPHSRSAFYSRVEPAVRDGKWVDLLEASFKTVPVRKPSSGKETAHYESIVRSWEELAGLVRALQVFHARQSVRPYLLAYAAFVRTLETVKRLQEAVFIEDIPRRLASYLEEGIIPDVYFRLGDRVYHYMIDEFQDTSPIQWANLRPLIENSLALNGSLFLVGDTKQAIYGFRDADFRIMAALANKLQGFPSVATDVRTLGVNYRSREAILDFVNRVFLEHLPGDEGLGRQGRLSELTDFRQEVKPENRGKGYVTLTLLDRRKTGEGGEEGNGPEEEDADGAPPEKAVLLDRIRELRRRGYAYSDLAVLTYKNKSVVQVSSWLNEAEPRIPFLPFSSLDIRTRKVTREVISLLKFLDAPPDDLAFCAFLLGDVFLRKRAADGRALGREALHGFLFEARSRRKTPLYVAFRERFPEEWEAYLERLFRLVGYFPLYDLVVLAFNTFEIFRLFPDEEATLVKLLESIKDFEAAGRNDLREFLERTSREADESSCWEIEVPLDVDAVRVMTVHKAKGLGFPVVLLLQYGQPYLAPEFTLDARGDSVRVLKLNRHSADADPDFRRIYDEAKDREDVNRLNALYVALTRAEEELHIIGVRSAKRKKAFPFTLLDERLPSESGWKAAADRASPRGPGGGEDLLLRFSEVSEGPPAVRTALHFRNIRRGIMMHDLLARVAYRDADWEARLGKAAGEWEGTAEEEAGEAEKKIRRFLNDSPLGSLFERRHGRRVENEFGICDEKGRLHRLDRVVIDPEGVTVLDYKTGETDDPEARLRSEENNREQMRLYLRLVSKLFPGLPARGFLAYIDRETWEEVG